MKPNPYINISETELIKNIIPSLPLAKNQNLSSPICGIIISHLLSNNADNIFLQVLILTLRTSYKHVLLPFVKSSKHMIPSLEN